MLRDDRAVVVLVVHEMHRAATHLRPIRQYRFMHVMPVHPRAAKRRDQRRMDVDDAMYEVRRNGHKFQEATHHDQRHPRLAARPKNGLAVVRVTGERRPWKHSSRNTGRRSEFEAAPLAELDTTSRTTTGKTPA